MDTLRLLMMLMAVVWAGRTAPAAGGRVMAPAPASSAASVVAPEALPELLGSLPGDSLAPVLRRVETHASSTAGAAEVALLLGRYHLARGEYREAIGAFTRAAARLDPARKPEARYRMGLAWLGLGEPAQARAVLEEVARSASPRRGAAGYAVAEAWLASQRPDRAREALVQSLADGPGECAPAVLERLATLDEQAGQLSAARGYRERIVQDWPRSFEAAGARRSLAAIMPGEGNGALTVVIGSFVDAGRARALASEAKRAGFAGAEVVGHGDGLAAVYEVRLGIYAGVRQARAAGEQASKALGVSAQVVKSR